MPPGMGSLIMENETLKAWIARTSPLCPHLDERLKYMVYLYEGYVRFESF